MINPLSELLPVCVATECGEVLDKRSVEVIDLTVPHPDATFLGCVRNVARTPRAGCVAFWFGLHSDRKTCGFCSALQNTIYDLGFADQLGVFKKRQITERGCRVMFARTLRSRRWQGPSRRWVFLYIFCFVISVVLIFRRGFVSISSCVSRLQLVRYDPPVFEADDPIGHFKDTRVVRDHHRCCAPFLAEGF